CQGSKRSVVAGHTHGVPGGNHTCAWPLVSPRGGVPGASTSEVAGGRLRRVRWSSTSTPGPASPHGLLQAWGGRMYFSALFIQRPIGTTLLTIALALAGAMAYQFLPVSPLPEVEFPTLEVQAALPGASPEIMASAVATPLERQFGRMAGLNEMTSTSFLGFTRISLQFDLSRDINSAARDVQAAITAAHPAQPPLLAQEQSGGFAGVDSGPRLRPRRPRPHVRLGRLHPAAETVAGARCGPRRRQRRVPPGRAGGRQSHRLAQLRAES